MTFSSLVDIERRRISEELHNRLGPNLVSVELNLRIIEKKIADMADRELLQLLGESQTLLAQSVAEIRDLTGELRPARLEYAGLEAALREFGQQYRRRTGVEVRISTALGMAGGEATRLDPALEWLLFRVIQEGLANCARHASAGRAEIDLRREADLIRLQISDDGVGFEPGTIGKGDQAPGLGLLEMRERVEAARGRFSISSRPGHGTHILVTVPVPAAPKPSAAEAPSDA